MMSADIPCTWRAACLLALALLLAACAPAQVVITAGPRDVLLPEQLQRAADAYTATARVQATQAAQVTAAALATRDTLAVEQTQAALSLTLSAAAAGATDAAAQRTQTALETSEFQHSAQQATYAAQTPTMAAVRTQAAFQATQAADNAVRAQSAGEFWAWLRWTTVAAVMALAAAFCVVVLARGLAYVVVEYQREQAATAREAFKLLAPGHWAEWQPGDGYRVYPLPGLLDAPPVVIENPAYNASHAHAWGHAVRLFAWWGDRHGFGIRDLGASGKAVVSDPDWRVLVKLLKDAGVLADAALPGKKGRATAWADGWGYARLSDELPRLALPFPAGADAPKVAFAVPTQHHMTTQHESATQEQP
jgi:hypothetical protein